jgi:hypothetical protein
LAKSKSSLLAGNSGDETPYFTDKAQMFVNSPVECSFTLKILRKNAVKVYQPGEGSIRSNSISFDLYIRMSNQIL